MKTEYMPAIAGQLSSFVIVNAITNASAEYEPNEDSTKIRIKSTITLDGSVFSSGNNNCDVVLEWYYAENSTSEPDSERIWTKDVKNISVTNNELQLFIPFTEIRGNAFNIKLYKTGNANTMIGERAKVFVQNIPDTIKQKLNNVKQITGGSDVPVRARLEAKEHNPKCHKNGNEDITISNRTNVFPLFNNEGNYIWEKDENSAVKAIFYEVEADINGTKQSCWIFKTRISDIKDLTE